MTIPDIRYTLQLDPPRSGEEVLTALERLVERGLVMENTFKRMSREIDGGVLWAVGITSPGRPFDVVVYADAHDDKSRLRMDTVYRSVVLGTAPPLEPQSLSLYTIDDMRQYIERVRALLADPDQALFG